ncbi:MAG: hypothetical protein KME45_31715 [Stenomitos rutilans HA7619-LM2]|jgi:hypothetical protein|nr:hypothetical protein [Stenomitos rutilans HA7619-LM2]
MSEDRSIPLLWQSLTVLGFIALVLGVLVVPAILERRTQRVIGIRANDVSKSGLVYLHLAQQHCQVQVRQLIEGDSVVNIDYSDRPEMIEDTAVEKVEQLLPLQKKCRELQSNHYLVPRTLGIHTGTSLHLLLDQILVVIQSKRAQGTIVPIVITIWLQAAEPVPNQPGLNFAQLRTQIQKITDQRAVVTIMGPTGQLQADLLIALKQNALARVCTVNDIDDCVKWAYQLGRTQLSIAHNASMTNHDAQEPHFTH